MDKQVESVVALLASKGVKTWNEDKVWRYMREMFPNAHDQYLQCIADRVQWVLTR